MSTKGTKRTAEANAKTSASLRAYHAARKAEKEHELIHNVVPRNCHPKHFQKVRDRLWAEVKEWFGGAR